MYIVTSKYMLYLHATVKLEILPGEKIANGHTCVVLRIALEGASSRDYNGHH